MTGTNDALLAEQPVLMPRPQVQEGAVEAALVREQLTPGHGEEASPRFFVQERVQHERKWAHSNARGRLTQGHPQSQVALRHPALNRPAAPLAQGGRCSFAEAGGMPVRLKRRHFQRAGCTNSLSEFSQMLSMQKPKPREQDLRFLWSFSLPATASRSRQAFPHAGICAVASFILAGCCLVTSD